MSDTNIVQCEGPFPSGNTHAFNLMFLFLLLSLSGIWLALFPVTSIGSKTILAVIGLTFLFGCWKTRRAVLFLVPAMYVPYLWLIADWQDTTWNSYRWQWIEMLWQLPGLLAEVMVHPLSNIWFEVVTTITTISIFLAIVLTARRSRWAAILTSIIVLLASIANSYICMVLYRA